MKHITIITAIVATAVVTSILFASCSTTNSNVLNNPVVQAAITALEKEAEILIADYIRTHVGGSGHYSTITRNAAIEAATKQLTQRHPDISPSIIHAAVASAALED